MASLLPHWETHDVESLRRFAAIRLVAVDVDGTIVRPMTSELYETVMKLEQSLRRHGVLVTIATGRSFSGAMPIMTRWATLKGSPVVLYNGSVIVRTDPYKCFSARTLNSDAMHSILSVCAEYDVSVLAYFFEGAARPLFDTVTQVERVVGWSRISRQLHDINGLVIEWHDEWDMELSSPTAVLVDVSRDASCIEPVLSKLLANGISVTRSGALYLEIRPSGSDKGAALASIANHLGLAQSEVLAIGDNDNDVEMLNWSGVSVTVSGASDRALTACDFVCRHGVAEGAVEILRLIKQAHRYFSRREA